MIQLRAWNSIGRGKDDDCVDDSVQVQVEALNGTGSEEGVFLHGSVMSQLRALNGIGRRGEDNYVWMV